MPPLFLATIFALPHVKTHIMRQVGQARHATVGHLELTKFSGQHTAHLHLIGQALFGHGQAIRHVLKGAHVYAYVRRIFLASEITVE